MAFATYSSASTSRSASNRSDQYAEPPHVFEIIDRKTGKVDDQSSLNYWIKGAGVDISRKSGLYQLDGYSNSLNIRRVNASGFFGSWAAGVFGYSESGYFCARRVR